MLGLPDGHVSQAPIARTAMLRVLGNSVQVQCAEVVGWWLQSEWNAVAHATASSVVSGSASSGGSLPSVSIEASTS